MYVYSEIVLTNNSPLRPVDAAPKYARERVAFPDIVKHAARTFPAHLNEITHAKGVQSACIYHDVCMRICMQSVQQCDDGDSSSVRLCSEIARKHYT